MAGKGILAKTEHSTYMFRLIMDGKVLDRIEVDEVMIATEKEVEMLGEAEFAKQYWDGDYDHNA